MRLALIVIAVVICLATAMIAVPLARGQDTRYVCTEFLGYSQTGQWAPYAAVTMNNGSTDRVETRLHDGGAAIRWADQNYEGWSNPINSPCASRSTTPDRIVLDVTHYNYLDANCVETTSPIFPHDGMCGSDPVSFMEMILRRAITTIHTKRPAVVSIVFQPVFGGPNHTTCPWPGAEDGVVRASFNHPYIQQAIGRVVGGDVTMGYDSHVRTCADYVDDMGHLVASAQGPLGVMVGTYYRDLALTQPTPLPPATATRTPTPPPTSTPTRTPTATPVPTAVIAATATVIPIETPTAVPCYDAVIAGDGDPPIVVRGAPVSCP